VNALAAIAGLAILALTAVVLKMLADGRERMRLLAPQIRLVAPPKEPAPKDEDEVYLAGPKFASGDGGAQ
jgi:hypothetical protein